MGAVVDFALGSGFHPEDVCAYVQNEPVGRAVIVALQEALVRAKRTPPKILEVLGALFMASSINQLVKAERTGTPVNQDGPVGVYIRNSRGVGSGTQALKKWEQGAGYRCKLVVTVGAYGNITRFIK